ncbi:pectin lyase-like protein [Aspergillus heteromorphus CBS 117.55]|uniref:Pectin lyase-like protein n=1 Tax=Aspergillus heteromorphus CBS 117.55 TaxID=1448321 RepID=A0A317URS8_9EURO|nr:pectin lyase-like protein [Aspergillus heteromorphus CBS 117.55]PWY64049.1 pectin lyase-like protein [Aspergillus heteromorphus CBS 117.55]
MASIRASIMVFVAHLFLLGLPLGLVDAVPLSGSDVTSHLAERSTDYWVGTITRQGTVPFSNETSSYKIYRNVMDYGAKGDGTTDDTAAINEAISSGGRCGEGCDSSTTTPALVYFPPGTYLVSTPIIQYYYTQMVGDANDLPVLKASAAFTGMAVIDSDPYLSSGANWYTNQNNFFRAVRNFVIDLTAMPESSGAGIHWQVGQATSLQNIRFEMIKGGGSANKQQGIFMDNGSGGFMSDLTFNGGNYGAFFGNQQFTTRNLTFNDCNTAIYMNWNWAWTFSSVTINNCQVGLNMSASPSNQTVGSVLMLDSTFTNTPTGVVTAFSEDSIPTGGGALVLDNVDFTGSTVAIASVDGTTILEGGSVVANYVQGGAYTSSSVTLKKRAPAVQATEDVQYIYETVTETITACAADYETSAVAALPTASGAAAADDVLTTDRSLPASLSVEYPAASGNSWAGFDSATSEGVQATGVSVVSSALESSPAIQTYGASVIPHQSGGVSYVPNAASSSAVYASASASSGHYYGTSGNATGQCTTKTVTKTRIETSLPSQAKPSALLNSDGGIVERSKPLYESYAASAFLSVKSAGAKGDGTTDDTAAIQKVLDSATSDQIVYFDHGAYIITDTIKVPKDIKITGEVWPMLMAYGDKFADQENPIPMLQIGDVGDVGEVELSDLIVETKGPAPGAILIQWNVAGSSQAAAGMWDVHARIGGSAGTELQSSECAKTPDVTTTPNSKCIGAFLLFHATEKSSPYLENTWFWTADHELDLSDHGQINVYNGRGVLIETQEAAWLWGTASEHNQLYNYQVSSAKNVFMGLIQTETPYYQANPNALTPFTPQTAWNDPDFSYCTTDSCRKAWGLRITNSSDTYVYGAGLYSFFDNYSQTCLLTESCQENIVEVDCSDVIIYGLSTKASTNMITSASGDSIVPQEGNESTYCSTIALFEQ